jgi:uncharacterized protein YnzC (UPF0291/DUF896 family)
VHSKKCIDKTNAELALKEKLLLKYDKEFKAKVEENIKLKRLIENLGEDLELEKKRNKNFEELYDKYQLRKGSGAVAPVNPEGAPSVSQK